MVHLAAESFRGHPLPGVDVSGEELMLEYWRSELLVWTGSPVWWWAMRKRQRPGELQLEPRMMRCYHQQEFV